MTHKAAVLCGTVTCVRFNTPINIIRGIDDVELFCENWGQGSQSSEDFCSRCGILGVLDEPEPEEVPYATIMVNNGYWANGTYIPNVIEASGMCYPASDWLNILRWVANLNDRWNMGATIVWRLM